MVEKSARRRICVGSDSCHDSRFVLIHHEQRHSFRECSGKGLCGGSIQDERDTAGAGRLGRGRHKVKAHL
jgi:hypothetical protein